MVALHPEIIYANGTTKVKIIARGGDGKVIDAEVMTLESSVSRNRS